MRTLATGLQVSTLLAILLLAAWFVTPWSDPALLDPLTSLGLILVSLATAAVGFYIAATRSFPRSLRWTWGFFGLGSVSSAVAEALFFYLNSILDVSPFPSVADVFYLLTYPLLLAGILSLPYAPMRREQRFLLNVDLSIVVLAAGVFLWHLVLAGLIQQGASGLPGLVALAYPLADLLILAGLVSLLQQDVKGVERRILVFFVVGISLTVLADVLFAARVSFQQPIVSGVLDVMWLVSRWAILAAAVWQAKQIQFDVEQSQGFSPLLRTNLLYVAVLAGTGLAFVALAGLIRSDLRLYGTLVGTFGISLLVLLRQYSVLQDNRRLRQEVEQLAITDVLTGLANRRRLNEVLALEVRRAQRYSRPLSIILIDLDRFKQYNDLHGHLQGDMLLRDCAQLFSAHLRANDLAARYGGDEFAIVLPETDVETSRLVAARLRRAVSEAFPPDLRVSISVGCAALPPDTSADALLGLADQAMYRDKPRHVRR